MDFLSPIDINSGSYKIDSRIPISGRFYCAIGEKNTICIHEIPKDNKECKIIIYKDGLKQEMAAKECAISQDGKAYAIINAGGELLISDIGKIEGSNYRNFIFHGDKNHWTCRKKTGRNTYLISNKMRYRKPIWFLENYLIDSDHVIYVADPNGLVIDNKILFNGRVLEYITCKSYPYASWIGCRHKDDQYCVYLLGIEHNIKELDPEIFTFAVTDNHKHYMVASKIHQSDYANGKEEFCIFKDGSIVSDGWKEVSMFSCSFSPDGNKWTCICKAFDNNEVPMINGVPVEDPLDHYCDIVFSDRGNHAFIGQVYANSSPDEDIHDIEKSFLFINGKCVMEGKEFIEGSLTFSPNGMDYALFENTGDSIKLIFNNEVIDEAEIIFSYVEKFSQKIVFLNSGRSISYYSIKDNNLLYNVNLLKV